MKSVRLPSGSTYYAHEHNALRSDAAVASFLHVHQQRGALALGTAPSNGQTVTFAINGTNVVFTAVTGTPTNPGDVKAPGTAAGFVANIFNALQNPTVTTASYIALSAANAQLVQYLGWALPSGGTTITPFSLNTTTYSPLTSINITTTVTGGTWTAQQMQLYVQPGTYYVGKTRVLFLGGSTPTFTAPSTNPRIDLVTADSSGTIALVTGTENASPVAPAYPANKLVLAEISHLVGEVALYDNDNQQTGQGFVLNDVRPFNAPPYISDPSQVATQIFIPWISSIAQGDVMFVNNTPAWTRLPAGTAGQVLTTQGAGANPTWVTTGQRFLLIGTTAGDYATSSPSFVDVDGINLTKTISALGNNQVIMLAYSFQIKDGVSGQAFWQIVEKNSGIVLASGGTGSTTFVTQQGLIQFPTVGTSSVIALQFKQNSGVNATINNGSSGGQFVTPSILIYA
jgi:hypothetical protein